MTDQKPKPDTHISTIRLPVELAEELALVARGNGTTVSDEVRRAIDAYIERKRSDPEFQKRLRARIEADQAILKSLATGVSE